MVVNVRLAPMLLLQVLVGDVHVLDLGVVVLVHVRGLEMAPVLPAVQIVRDVEVLLGVHHFGVVVLLRLDRHDVYRPGRTMRAAPAAGEITLWCPSVHRTS
jgi:hypothetical protein